MDSFCKLLLYVLLFFFLYNLLTSNTIENFTDKKNSAKEENIKRAGWGGYGEGKVCDDTSEAMDEWGHKWTTDEAQDQKAKCCEPAKKYPGEIRNVANCSDSKWEKIGLKDVKCNHRFVRAQAPINRGGETIIKKGDVIRCLWNPERKSCDFWRNDGKKSDSSMMINCTSAKIIAGTGGKTEAEETRCRKVSKPSNSKCKDEGCAFNSKDKICEPKERGADEIEEELNKQQKAVENQMAVRVEKEVNVWPKRRNDPKREGLTYWYKYYNSHFKKYNYRWSNLYKRKGTDEWEPACGGGNKCFGRSESFTRRSVMKSPEYRKAKKPGMARWEAVLKALPTYVKRLAKQGDLDLTVV